MKYFNSTVAILSTFLVLGILSSYFIHTKSDVVFYLLPLCFLLLVISWFIARSQLMPNPLFGLLTFTVFFGIGFLNYQLRLPEFQHSHYSNLSKSNVKEIFQLKVVEVLKPNKYYQNYISEVKFIKNTPLKGKILLSIRKDSLNHPALKVDDGLVIYAPYFETSKPLNPYQFDYSAYLRNLDIYHLFRVSRHEIIKKFEGTTTVVGLAEQLRNHAIQKLKLSPIQDDERSIIQALVLGQRRDISTRLYREYASAGAIHILAVSGLHVGILFLILSRLLSQTSLLPGGRVIKVLLLLLFLWGFALISGLSASVIRAVTMFSFFSLAQLSKRPTNSFNTLFLSLFVLLLLNPKWVFQVGFQLSYLAVLFILLFQPVLYRAYFPKNLVFKKIWGIITVSIAAQMGILPLSLYYFHQFPGLFLITNVIILPFLGLLLSLGIVLVILATLNMLPEFYAHGYNQLIGLLNSFVAWIADQKYFIIENIHFSNFKVIGSYVFLFCLLLLLKKVTYKNILLFGGGTIFLLGIWLYSKYELSHQEMIFFHKYRHTIITYRNANSLLVLSNDTTQETTEHNPIKKYITEKNIKQFSTQALPSLFVFEDRSIMVLDSTGVFPCSFSAEIILITQNSRVNLDRALDCFQPELVIADGSNTPFYVDRWAATCKKRKLPFHDIAKKGAFILKKNR